MSSADYDGHVTLAAVYLTRGSSCPPPVKEKFQDFVKARRPESLS